MSRQVRKLLKEKRKPLAEINVVPYIDVMLVLLVIFMITAPLLTQGVKVNLPQAQAKVIDDDNKTPIVLSVDVNGRYYLNISADPSLPLPSDQILTRVAAELQLAKQKQEVSPKVMVRGDLHVDYGKVVEAMSLLQQAGADEVGLMTKSPESNADFPASANVVSKNGREILQNE